MIADETQGGLGDRSKVFEDGFFFVVVVHFESGVGLGRGFSGNEVFKAFSVQIKSFILHSSSICAYIPLNLQSTFLPIEFVRSFIHSSFQ